MLHSARKDHDTTHLSMSRSQYTMHQLIERPKYKERAPSMHDLCTSFKMRLHVRRTFKHCNVEAGHKAGIDGILHIVATCKRSQGTRKGLTDLKMPAWVADGPDFPQRVRLLRRQHRIRPDVRESLTRWLLHAPATAKLLETVKIVYAMLRIKRR